MFTEIVILKVCDIINFTYKVQVYLTLGERFRKVPQLFIWQGSANYKSHDASGHLQCQWARLQSLLSA